MRPNTSVVEALHGPTRPDGERRSNCAWARAGDNFARTLFIEVPVALAELWTDAHLVAAARFLAPAVVFRLPCALVETTAGFSYAFLLPALALVSCKGPTNLAGMSEANLSVRFDLGLAKVNTLRAFLTLNGGTCGSFVATADANGFALRQTEFGHQTGFKDISGIPAPECAGPAFEYAADVDSGPISLGGALKVTLSDDSGSMVWRSDTALVVDAKLVAASPRHTGDALVFDLPEASKWFTPRLSIRRASETTPIDPNTYGTVYWNTGKVETRVPSTGPGQYIWSMELGRGAPINECSGARDCGNSLSAIAEGPFTIDP